MARCLVAAGLALVLVGCTTGERDGAPSLLTGTIVTLERDAEGISAFTLRSGSKTYRVEIAREIAYGFDLEHLEQHRVLGQRVRCRLDERDGRLVATAIFDA